MADSFRDDVNAAVKHLLDNMAEQKSIAAEAEAERMRLGRLLLDVTDPIDRENLRDQMAILRDLEAQVHARDLASTEWVLTTGSQQLAYDANKHGKALVRVTWVLAGATVVLAIATVALIFATVHSVG